jgi:dTDP-glucose 4,6-dehydratase
LTGRKPARKTSPPPLPSRILVTGGAGFIGSNFIHHLLHTRSGADARCCPDTAHYGVRSDAKDLRVLNLDALTYAGNPANLKGIDHLKGYSFAKADITDAAAVETAFKAFRPELVVHFAAESHVDRSIEAGEVFTRTNVVGTQVLLDAARRHDVAGFVHVSTDEVYGSIAEGSATEGSPLRPSSPYSASKAASDLLALAHHHTYGLPVAVTRCTNNYGPRQHPEKLIPKAIALARQGKPVPIYGSGRQVRDWLYVKDHCTAVEHVAALRRWGEVFNVAGRCEKTNLEVVGEVLDRAGSRAGLERVGDRPGHDLRYCLDDAKLRSHGWAPRVELARGLAWALESAP